MKNIKRGNEIGSDSRSWEQWKVGKLNDLRNEDSDSLGCTVDSFPYSYSDAKLPATFRNSYRSGVIISP